MASLSFLLGVGGMVGDRAVPTGELLSGRAGPAVEGLVADDAAIAKAAGINLSLWTGLAMLVLGLAFLAWMLLDPPRVETGRADLSRPPGHDED